MIQVKASNPLYGDVPYTVQNGGCGDRGEYIHVTPSYTINIDDLAAKFGPPGEYIHTLDKTVYSSNYFCNYC